jgi:pilus assembly protein CpaF
MVSALQLVVQIARMPDGSRKIITVSEITGMEGQVVTMQDIYHFEQRGIDSEGRIVGDFHPTGIRPQFAERFVIAGIELPQDVFGAAGW